MEHNPYASFELERAAKVFPIDLNRKSFPSKKELQEIYGKIKKHKRTGQRVGQEWILKKKDIFEERLEGNLSRKDIQPLETVCTKFCTHIFFPYAMMRVNMIAHVTNLYEHVARSLALPYDIIFKGGVMLRLLLLQFWRDHPRDINETIQCFFQKEGIVGMGDFDFEIVSRENDPSPEDQHRWLLLNTVVLLLLQKQLEDGLNGKEPNSLLNTSWNRDTERESLRKRLQEEVQHLPSTHPLHGIKVDYVYIGGDLLTPPSGYNTDREGKLPEVRRNLLVYKCGAKRCVSDLSVVLKELGICLPSPEIHSSLYTTCNTYIGEDTFQDRKRIPQLNSLFHLSRIKHSFVMYYTTRQGRKQTLRLSGEVVDLSMANPTDEIHREKLRLMRTMTHQFRRYSFLGISKHTFRFPGFTPFHFLIDLYFILHRNDTAPWDICKYAKRLGRYAACLLLYTFSPDVKGEPLVKQRAMQDLIRYLGAPDVVVQRTLRTHIASVDAFAQWEHECARTDGRRAPHQWKVYLKKLHAYLRHMMNLYVKMEDPIPNELRLNEEHIEYASKLLRHDHVSTYNFTFDVRRGFENSTPDDQSSLFDDYVNDSVQKILNETNDHGVYTKALGEVVRVASRHFSKFAVVGDMSNSLLLSHLDDLRACVSDELLCTLGEKKYLQFEGSQKIHVRKASIKVDVLCNGNPIDYFYKLEAFYDAVDKLVPRGLEEIIKKKLEFPKGWTVTAVRLKNAKGASNSFAYTTNEGYDYILKGIFKKNGEEASQIVKRETPAHEYITKDLHLDPNDTGHVSAFINLSVSIFVSHKDGSERVYTTGVALLSFGIRCIHSKLEASILKKHTQIYHSPRSRLNIPSYTSLGFLLYRLKREEPDAGLFYLIAVQEWGREQVEKAMKSFRFTLTPMMKRAATLLGQAWQRSATLSELRLTYVGIYALEDHFV